MSPSSEKRRSKILEAIVQDYVQTAVPVGSKALRDRYQLDVSPATIRIEMGSLEQHGYITHPHTSAGRIPTDKGYRHYVDNLMVKSASPPPQIGRLMHDTKKLGHDIDRLLEHTVHILSALSDYTAVLLMPSLYRSAIKVVQMVMVNLNQVMVVLLTREGLTNELLIDLSANDRPHPIGQGELNRVSNLLTEKLEGKSLEALTRENLQRMIAEMPEYEALLTDTFELIEQSMKTMDTDRMTHAGISHMAKQPEFKDIDKLNAVLSVLEENRVLAELLKSRSEETVTIKIGHETDIEEMKSCSIVMSSYGRPDQARGTLAIMGPTRMHYEKAYLIVNEVCRVLSELLSEEI